MDLSGGKVDGERGNNFSLWAEEQDSVGSGRVFPLDERCKICDLILPSLFSQINRFCSLFDIN